MDRSKQRHHSISLSGSSAPGPEQLPAQTMPRLYSGANPEPDGPTWTYLALTRYQLAHIENWAHGNFDADWTGSPPPPVPFDQIPVARQAWESAFASGVRSAVAMSAA